MHVLEFKYNYSKDDINKIRKQKGLKSNRIIGSHEIIIDLIGEEIKTNSIQEFFDFQNNILQLRTVRTDSDYNNVRIDSTLSKEAYSKALFIKRKLKHIFRNEGNS